MSQNAPIELRDSRLLTMHFELNRSFAPNTEARIDTQLSLAHSYVRDDKEQLMLRLFMKVRAQGENAPFTAEVELGSFFSVTNPPEDLKLAARVAEIEAAAIVFPYMRETLADLTRRAGMAPLHLAPVDFVAFYKQNHPDE